ncbi:MAG: ATP-dependent Clp protease adaptor ClpS, partial [Phycisphaerales bacterium]|nr:ATP-dependent Clp protease adaptor ClpS [Phycisphaerales bacterium]
PSTPPAPTPRPEPTQNDKQQGGAAVASPSRAKAAPVSRPLDQYKVLLHNDDLNEMMFVVQTIVEVVPMAAQQAFSVMAEAHKSGVALVTVTHLELAELYQDRFQSKGITATIEKA